MRTLKLKLEEKTLLFWSINRTYNGHEDVIKGITTEEAIRALSELETCVDSRKPLAKQITGFLDEIIDGREEFKKVMSEPNLAIMAGFDPEPPKAA